MIVNDKLIRKFVMKILGFILIVVGLVMLLLRGIDYTKKEPRTITWPYYAGGIAIVAGIFLVLIDTRKTKD